MILKKAINKPLVDLYKGPDFDFGRINLVVGKNASGKSRLVRGIAATAEMISNSSAFIYSGETILWFKDFLGNQIKYRLLYGENENIEEDISVNNSIIYKRDGNGSFITSSTSSNKKIKPPADKLIFHARRDAEEYPEIEKIAVWAERTCFFSFNRMDYSNGFVALPRNGRSLEQEVFNMIEKMTPAQKEAVINNFNQLGYHLELVNVFYRADKYFMQFSEKGFSNPINHEEMSQGMFRALMLLFFIENLSGHNSISTLIIDDLGEGLDYDRVAKLGKFLLKWLEKHPHIQLIATSNDSFLMDVFPIEHWNILVRDDRAIKCLNYQNSKAVFDEFKLTGLMPFDLLSSDYLLSKTV